MVRPYSRDRRINYRVNDMSGLLFALSSRHRSSSRWERSSSQRTNNSPPSAGRLFFLPRIISFKAFKRVSQPWRYYNSTEWSGMYNGKSSYNIKCSRITGKWIRIIRQKVQSLRLITEEITSRKYICKSFLNFNMMFHKET